ncbi:MAG: hydantoinase B/oxoprolinase family protein [Candidatus Tectomicrobia bacterium]|nr:hydantoinase B/oxoprolinase family protein [Candidatus Tectomicrobia bacterium]
MTGETPRVDPLSVAVIQNRLLSITEEMGVVLLRTTRSQILNECHDFSTAIFNQHGELLAQAEDVPIHVAGNHFMARAILKSFSAEEIAAGDIYLMNDPYSHNAGAHLQDWTFFRPVFHEGKPVFWVMCRAHQMDEGGSMPMGFNPLAYDIIAEGLRIPPIKLHEKDQPIRSVVDLILQNVRFPAELRADLLAFAGCLKLGEQRLHEVIEKYGYPLLAASVDAAMESSEKAMRAEIARIPNGVYEDEVYADHDGATDQTVRVRCRITVEDESMCVDFTGSEAQRRFINSPLPNTYAGAFIGIFTSVTPDIIHNEGCYRPVTIVAPEGSVVNPVYPATTGCCTLVLGCHIIDVVMKTLGQAIPRQVSAGWASHFTINLSGRRPESGELYANVNFCGNGGSGAIWGYDGWPHIAPVNCSGGIIKASIEMLEMRNPWQVREYALRTDSAGAGTYRGGLGVSLRFVNHGYDSHFILLGDDHSAAPPFGQDGGKPATRSRCWIERGDERLPVRTKQHYVVQPGDHIVTETTGGGGVGDPLARPAALVREDVVNGYVSVERARSDYGVALDTATLALDEAATARLRGRERAGEAHGRGEEKSA